MNVELSPSPEHTVNILVRLRLHVVGLYGVNAQLLKEVRCVDPGAFASSRLVAIPGADTYEWQVQLTNTAFPPEELLARVKTLVLEISYRDELAIAKGKTRNTRCAFPAVPTVKPRLF